MACHNNAHTISEAIASIYRQSFDDWELIIVNDASTDDLHGALQNAPIDRRTTVIDLDENVGSGRARNIAIDNTESPFVAIMDADDMSISTRLRQQADYLTSNPDVAAVASQLAEFGDWGGPVASKWPTDDRQIRRRQGKLKMPIPHPSTMIRRDVVEAVGGYDESCRRAQDYAMFLRLRDHRLACLPTVHVLYRTTRPLPVRYALKNGRYADLARRRYLASLRGDDMLPDNITHDVGRDLSSLKDWSVRRFREAVRR